jgi:hypothetical protein
MSKEQHELATQATPVDARQPKDASKGRRWYVGPALWVVAFLLATSAMVYQRATGPTYPYRDRLVVGGKSYKLSFPRSSELVSRSPEDPRMKGAEVGLPAKPPGVTAMVHWRRYPRREDYIALPMSEVITSTLIPGKPKQTVRTYSAEIPPQPAAGKVEYYVTVDTPKGEQRFPAGNDTIVLRYKDYVPLTILVPHVTAMILVIIVGMRAGLSALFQPRTTRRYAWVALILMTIGGMTLGPLVQKYAFGEYWTGFPNGGDWTDNKMLFMWLAWLVACVVLGASTKPVTGIGRAATFVAALVMTVVYLIPHSMGGSQLDYSAIEQGADPQDAIRTGKQ